MSEMRIPVNLRITRRMERVSIPMRTVRFIQADIKMESAKAMERFSLRMEAYIRANGRMIIFREKENIRKIMGMF